MESLLKQAAEKGMIKWLPSARGPVGPPVSGLKSIEPNQIRIRGARDAENPGRQAGVRRRGRNVLAMSYMYYAPW